MSKPPEPQVHSITGAAAAHSVDMDTRIRRYLISMGIRTVCVLLVFVVDGPLRWVFAVLAVILPYVAVVMANVAGGGPRGKVAPVTPAEPVVISLPTDAEAYRPLKPEGNGQSESAEQGSHDSGERTA